MIKAINTNIKQISGPCEVEMALEAMHMKNHLLRIEFLTTAIYPSRQEEQQHKIPLVIVPRDIGYEACEKLRALLWQLEINEFPLQVQQAILYAQAIGTDAEVCYPSLSSSVFTKMLSHNWLVKPSPCTAVHDF